MGDAGVREAERRWRATGAVEDRAEWLRLRIRAGELTAEQVERAGYAGDAAARFAAELPSEWLDALGRLDRLTLLADDPRAALRVTLAHALALLCVEHAPVDDPLARRAERGALEVVAEPRPERRRRAAAALRLEDVRVLLLPDVARKRGHALSTWAVRVALDLALGREDGAQVGGEHDDFALPAAPLVELAKAARRLAPRDAIEAACAALAGRELGDPP